MPIPRKIRKSRAQVKCAAKRELLSRTLQVCGAGTFRDSICTGTSSNSVGAS